MTNLTPIVLQAIRQKYKNLNIRTLHEHLIVITAPKHHDEMRIFTRPIHNFHIYTIVALNHLYHSTPLADIDLNDPQSLDTVFQTIDEWLQKTGKK